LSGDYGRVRYQDELGEWTPWSEAYLLDLAPHTIAHWRFENGTAGSEHPADQDNWYSDVSGNGNHLSSWTAGSRPAATADIPFATVPQIGQKNTLSLDFDASDDLGTFGAQTGAKMIESYAFSKGWTIEATFKMRTLNWQVIVGKDGKRALGPEAPFWIKVMDSNKKIECLFIDDNDDFHWIQTLDPILANQWYSVAITYDNAVARLYLKGEGDADYVFQGSVAASAGAKLGQYPNPWTVGRGMFDGNPVDFMNGLVDEVRISDVPLDPSSFIGAAVEPDFDFDVDGMADDWELAYFSNIADAVPSEDPDGDLLGNFAEYGLGGHPMDPADTGYPITFEPDGVAGFNYVYPRRISPAGLAYHLETTTNLVSGVWTNSGYVELPNPGSFAPEFEAVTNQVPTGVAAQKFIRLIME